MDGYGVFRDWMMVHTELYVDNYITTQSLASAFMITSGCYDKVAQISGVLQQLISRCVVGGRVMTYSNKTYHAKMKNADFHLTSPSPLRFSLESFLMQYRPLTSNTLST